MQIDFSFWSFLAGVLGTVFLNQLSRILDRPTDRLLGGISKSLARRITVANERFRNEVQQYAKEPELLLIVGFESTKHEIRAMFYFLFTISLYALERTFVFVTGNPLSVITGYVIPVAILIAGLYNLGKSARRNLILQEVKFSKVK
jgi:hypothetical protein